MKLVVIIIMPNYISSCIYIYIYINININIYIYISHDSSMIVPPFWLGRQVAIPVVLKCRIPAEEFALWHWQGRRNPSGVALLAAAAENLARRAGTQSIVHEDTPKKVISVSDWFENQWKWQHLLDIRIYMVDINNNYFINPELIWVEFFISHHWMITKLVITHGTGIQIQGALMMYWFDQLFFLSLFRTTASCSHGCCTERMCTLHNIIKRPRKIWNPLTTISSIHAADDFVLTLVNLKSRVSSSFFPQEE